MNASTSDQASSPRAWAAVAALGLLSLTIPGCRESDDVTPLPPVPNQQETGFADPQALLDAIEAGRFVERAHLEQQIQELAVPDLVEVDFTHGTAVPRSERPKFEKLANVLGSDLQLRVDVIGCSDPTGGAAFNRRLSQARAEAVAKRLETWKVPSWQIGRVEGRGEACAQQKRMVQVRPYLAGLPRGEV